MNVGTANVLGWVETELLAARREIGSVSFTVLRHLVREEDGLWYIPVRPDQTIDRKNVFYDLLNEIEERISRDHGVDVTIVPVAPEA